MKPVNSVIIGYCGAVLQGLLLAFDLAAQSPAATAPRQERFVTEHWTVADGLPVNGITHVVQSRDGYLWLGTWDGLVRFDGVRFTSFNTGNTEALPGNRIVDLKTGSGNDLWLLTDQRQLVRYSAGEFTWYGTSHGVRESSALFVYTDSRGDTWLATDSGLSRLDGKKFVAVAPDRIRGVATALLRASRGDLWAAILGDGVYRIGAAGVVRLELEDAPASTHIRSLFADRDGVIWAGTDRGAYRSSGGGFAPARQNDGSALSNVVWQITANPAGDSVWLSGSRGLYTAVEGQLRTMRATQARSFPPPVYFDATGSAWYADHDLLYRNNELVFKVQHPQGTPVTNSAIRNFVLDREGSVWIAADNGLHRLKPSVFTAVSSAEGLPSPRVSVVTGNREDAVWVGTQGGGLGRITGDRVTAFRATEGFPSYIESLMQDSESHLWIGSGSGILRCRLPVMECGPPPGGAHAFLTGTRVLYQDRSADVWAGTLAGLFRLQRGEWIRVIGPDVLGSAFPRVIIEDRAGAIWIGTSGKGVFVYGNGRLSRITTADGLPGDNIRALHEDARGRIWVGTEGRGLARIVTERSPSGATIVSGIRPIRQRDGLFDEMIHWILEDAEQRLWMSTNRGIFWVTLTALDAFADGRVPRIHSTSYTERDGMRDREANGGSQPAGFRGRDGRLWFATQDGVAIADPSRIRRNDVVPPVVIERLATRDSEFRPGGAQVKLDSRTRDFEVDYTALSLLAPENVRFRYRLEGLTDEWTEAGSRRTAVYTNVPPGDFTFRVIAGNNDDLWNEAGATLSLSVAPRFHETRTAWILLAGSLMLLALSGFQWRVRSLRMRERELTQLVETRTTALREHQQQLESSNAQLADQATKLTELYEARSRLFANLSHEFRTPLTLIISPLKSLLDGRHGVLPASAREQGEMMVRNAQRLLRLINQILDLAKLQARGVTLDRRSIDLVAFTRNATLGFAPLAERRGVGLKFASGLERLNADVDPGQMEKVVLNLLSNALKFTGREGSVEVSVESDASAGIASIVVRDTGVGIERDKLSRVFERFYQADASETRRYEGTGIGLALVKELVELHGGSVAVESEPGRGSVFTVRIPIAGDTPLTTASAPDQSVTRAIETAIQDVPASGEFEVQEISEDRTTVLVVDDNADVRTYVRSILEPSFRVIAASDGRAGLDMARELLPDLIVADVMMPELDGFALARSLKGDAMTDAIPVILLTARAASEDHIAGLATGADGYITKPFDPDVLIACIENLLAQRRRLRERFRQGEVIPPAAPAAQRSALEERLRSILSSSIHDPGFGPEELATAAALSYHQLYRGLRDDPGITPSHFIRGVRAECAAELLRQGSGSVTEIAYSVGFESLSYFRRAFRERFDASPSEFLGKT